MRTTQPAAALVGALVVCLLLTSCNSKAADDKAQPAAGDATTPAADVSGNPDTWPLTGLPVKADQSSIKKHPVLVLKMDNTPSSAPQQGLGSADLVVEELVEGGVTRLAAFYYSDIPGDVGPVRSMRASDIGIVSSVGATVVTSGAAAVTLERIRGAGIPYVTEGSAGFYRESSRYAPYNLFTDLQDVERAVAQKPGRPVDYLPFAADTDDTDDTDAPRGQKARELSAVFSGGHTTTWSYRGGTYVNDNTYAADDDEFPADTVLVLKVKVGDAGYTDPAGNPVPETQFQGTGEAMLFHGGRLVRGTWSKTALDAPITLSTQSGPLPVPPGHTWIELVPAATGTVTFD